MLTVTALLLATLIAKERPWEAEYTVAFERGGDVHRAVVTARFHWRGGGSAPDSLELSFLGDSSSPSLDSFVRDAQARRAQGDTPDENAVTQSGNSLNIPVRRDGTAMVLYTIELGHADGESNRSYDETPRRLEGFDFWTGRSLFAVPGGVSGRVTFETNDDDVVTTSLPPSGKSGFSFSEETELCETFLTAGVAARPVKIGRSTIQIQIDAALGQDAGVIAAQLERYFETADDVLGAPPPDRSVIVVQKGPQGLLDGSMIGHDASAVVPSAGNDETHWRRLMCHELFHLYNGFLLRLDDRNMWFSEGFTEYFTHRLLADSGDLSSDSFLHELKDWVKDYSHEAGEIGLQEAGNLGAKNNTLIYKGGALTALILDIRLRQASRGKRSLEDVMKALLSECLPGRKKVSRAKLEELVHQIGGKSTQGFFETHIEGNTRLPIEDELAAIGLAVTNDEIALPAMQDVAVKLILCPGMTIEPTGIRIQRTSAKGLEAEDLLVEVAGKSVRDWTSLQMALARFEPGDDVPMVVERQGKRRKVAIELGGRGETIERETRRVVDIEVKPLRDRRAKAIREAIFKIE